MTDPDRYVKTRDIQAAIKGQETAVLDALGIPWQQGKPHIHCPYPDHGGEDDWRWDEGKSRAFCSYPCGEHRRRAGYLAGLTGGGPRPAARWSAMIWRTLSMPSLVKAGTPSSPTP
jgi:hypothetical protein